LVAAVRLPRLANFDDLAPLEREPGFTVRFTAAPEWLRVADLVVVPGSKTTVADLAWLRETRLADALVERARRGGAILGICGGCQMLGEQIDDPHGVESPTRSAEGLGVLPLRTAFEPIKRTTRVRAELAADSLLGRAGTVLAGYEIHMGRTHGTPPVARVVERNGHPCADPDGARAGHAVVGTMLHGVFDNASVRAALRASLRRHRGAPRLAAAPAEPAQSAFERLADALEAALDIDAIARLVAG
jgi:adenosylcobyric acid synthase